MSSNPPNPAGPAQGYQCPWCGKVSDPQQNTSCPACGSPLDVRTIVSESGWYELPAIKDMARIQFGKSACQIEGKYTPVADMNLALGDSVYFSHHILLWKDPAVDIKAMSLKGAWSRVFAGLPLIMTEAHGPGHIAFSRDEPGEMIALPLNPGQAVDVREHVFMVATGSVAYDWFQTNIWFQTGTGDDRETNYPLGQFMDRFQAAQGPGLLLLHGAGNVFVRQLAPGQAILIKPTSLLYKDPSVNMHLHIEHPGGTWRSWRSWGERYLWLRLIGPGRVAVQSAYAHMEDKGSSLTGVSYSTTRVQW